MPTFARLLPAKRRDEGEEGDVMHKTSAPTRTVVVMFEPAGVAPTGDA